MALKYVGVIPDGEWRALLRAYLESADEFRVHMPDGDGPLSFGRAQIAALPGVTARPWSGMGDAVEFAGELTPGVRELFLEIEKSLESFDAQSKLWDYELLRSGQVILSIGDYHDLQIDPTA